ncbi:alpha-1,6-mannosyltransferase subunit [Phellopilus nigrolimitatus]|nr:alpha-1,6-mannosyltransferase subunit [Phellopilus nigrolimitatus]
MDLIILATAWSHVLLTPFTKVEESFNLHATHDVLMYGVGAPSLAHYDHFAFPGAVPRSFLGSVLLAWCTAPDIRLFKYFDAISTKSDLLICVRLVLATLNAIGLCILRRAVSKRFGFSTALNLAYSCILSRAPNGTRPSQQSVITAVSLLTFTAVVYRAEILLLLGPLVLQSLLARWISFSAVVKTGLLVALASISATTLIDSYFWSRWPLWPELHSLYYNVYQGKSADWGISPLQAYFSTHLPKLLLSSVPLAALGFLAESRVRTLLVSPLLFVALISGLAHKEWRFVVYTVPLFNVAAARGAYWMSVPAPSFRRDSAQAQFSGVFVSSSSSAASPANLLVTAILTYASSMNYPGGVALTRFNEMYKDSSRVHVHIDNLAAQTGASLFLHAHAPPYPPSLPAPPHAKDWHADAFPAAAWANVGCVSGFDGLGVRRGADGASGLWDKVPMLEFRYSEKLCILERK